jgi:hypothetical protein
MPEVDPVTTAVLAASDMIISITGKGCQSLSVRTRKGSGFCIYASYSRESVSGSLE